MLCVVVHVASPLLIDADAYHCATVMNSSPSSPSATLASSSSPPTLSSSSSRVPLRSSDETAPRLSHSDPVQDDLVRPFFSGNPLVQVTRGEIHLLRDMESSERPKNSTLPVRNDNYHFKSI